MTWSIAGSVLEACSCKMFCPCVMGPGDPTQGWCSAALLFALRTGEIDGVHLDGCKVVWVADFPGNFAKGNGVSRLYIDAAATPEQRAKLEALWHGQRGGPVAIFNMVTTQWLSTQYAKIEVQAGDTPSFSVSQVGAVTLQPITNERGERTRVEHTPAWSPMEFQNEGIAQADGSYWFDPEMRRWVSGGFGAMQSFSWTGE
jgi:hypothetical protein